MTRCDLSWAVIMWYIIHMSEKSAHCTTESFLSTTRKRPIGDSFAWWRPKHHGGTEATVPSNPFSGCSNTEVYPWGRHITALERWLLIAELFSELCKNTFARSLHTKFQFRSYALGSGNQPVEEPSGWPRHVDSLENHWPRVWNT